MRTVHDKCLYHSNVLEVHYKSGILIRKKNGTKDKALRLHNGKDKIMSLSRLGQRLLRLDPKLVRCIDDSSLFVSCNGRSYLIDIDTWKILRTDSYRIGMHNPLCCCPTTSVYGTEKGFIFGEYFSNEQRESVKLLKYTKQGLDVIYEFPEGRVRHIHGCINDRANKRIIILTGDDNEESGIWELPDNSKEIKPILNGRQQYRSCVAFYDDGHIIFATDTPLEQNYIYSYDEKNKELKTICKIAGPCIYGTSLSKSNQQFFIFATSVEPDSTLNTIRYLMTRKRSQFIWDNKAHIYFGNPTLGFKDILSFKKDKYPMGLMQLGNCEFGYSETDDTLYVLPIAVNHIDGKTLCFSIDDLLSLFYNK